MANDSSNPPTARSRSTTGCRPADEAPPEDRRPLVDDCKAILVIEAADDRPVRLETGIGGEEVEVRARRRELPQRLETLREEGIVAVERRRELARRDAECVIPRGRGASVFLSKENDFVAEGR